MRMLMMSFLLVALAAFVPAIAQESAPEPFSLPQLPYAYDALEPAIDAETMEIHHARHHKSYVDNLNAEIAKDEALRGQGLEDILANLSGKPAALRNNAGGHWNHSFFWTVMAPRGAGGQPTAALQRAITDAFGSMDAFRAAFEAAGTSRFGSGWAWLIVNGEGRLEVTSTPNQDNPLMDVAEKRGAPILGNDVWEHAYYLQYQNKRGDYLKNWWQIVNWRQVSANYEKAIAAR